MNCPGTVGPVAEWLTQRTKDPQPGNGRVGSCPTGAIGWREAEKGEGLAMAMLESPVLRAGLLALWRGWGTLVG